jgi:hypothetical protein
VTFNKRFDATEFQGIVQLKNYAIMPDGKQYIGIAGKCSVVKDEEMIGFEVRGGETANWMMRIDGDKGSVNVLGCQVRMVHQFDDAVPEDLDQDYYEVP